MMLYEEEKKRIKKNAGEYAFSDTFTDEEGNTQACLFVFSQQKEALEIYREELFYAVYNYSYGNLAAGILKICPNVELNATGYLVETWINPADQSSLKLLDILLQQKKLYLATFHVKGGEIYYYQGLVVELTEELVDKLQETQNIVKAVDVENYDSNTFVIFKEISNNEKTRIVGGIEWNGGSAVPEVCDLSKVSRQ